MEVGMEAGGRETGKHGSRDGAGGWETGKHGSRDGAGGRETGKHGSRDGGRWVGDRETWK